MRGGNDAVQKWHFSANTEKFFGCIANFSANTEKLLAFILIDILNILIKTIYIAIYNWYYHKKLFAFYS